MTPEGEKPRQDSGYRISWPTHAETLTESEGEKPHAPQDHRECWRNGGNINGPHSCREVSELEELETRRTEQLGSALAQLYDASKRLREYEEGLRRIESIWQHREEGYRNGVRLNVAEVDVELCGKLARSLLSTPQTRRRSDG